MRSTPIRTAMAATAKVLAVLLLLSALAPCPAWGQSQDESNRLDWWRQARFGLFVHWGPVSLKGTEIGWSRGGDRRGRTGTGSIPVEVYDNLYKEFNPTEFNAEEWIEIAQNAGMKYLVFTTKHHDGFCMFDSALTDYKITNSPFKRDIVKELADACHKAGMGLGFYYSQPDWHHPDYRTENHAKYIEYLHGQVRELCTNYGKLDIIWFDGLGGAAEDWDSPNLVKMIRELQPGIIINNRAGRPEDFDTPEQRVGKFQRGRAWETCMTICRQWAWKPDDTMKSLEECLQVLINCAGGDGNLLFNVGPMPSGQIESRQISRLAEMGAWMNMYGETIYGTRGGPFMPGPWGASTCRDKTIYVHLFRAADSPILLPPIPAKILSHTLLTGGKATVEQDEQGIRIQIPETAQQDIDTILALEIDQPAVDIKPASIPSNSLAFGKKASASNVYQNTDTHGPAKAFDDDDSTRWATDYGVQEAWLQVDLGEPTPVNRAVVKEEYGRVQEFAIEYKAGDEWKTAHEGSRIGDVLSVEFPQITAQVFRLNIKKASEGPTLWEFQLMGPEKK